MLQLKNRVRLEVGKNKLPCSTNNKSRGVQLGPLTDRIRHCVY